MKLYDVIMWDPPGQEAEEILAYKQGPIDFNNHTQLIVHASQEAIFFKDGRDLDVFDAGKHTLTTDKLPLLSKIMNLPTGGQNQFHSEVYFINKIVLNDLKWGTPEPIMLEDPIEGVNIHVRANGYFGAKITDGRKFLRKVVGTKEAYTKTEYNGYLRAKLIERVKGILGQAIAVQQISVLKINAYITPLSDEIKNQLTPFFADYGIELINFSFNNISPLEEDLKEINASKIAAKKMALESEARAKMREREGYTYQQEQSYGVLNNAAKNQGTAGGLMGAGMGLGMGFGVGGALGGGMANIGQTLDLGQNVRQPHNDTETCPSCNQQIPAGAKFCPKCGKPVVKSDQKICPKCGAVISANAKFCAVCGEKLISVCKNCGQELFAGTPFCSNCGTKQE